MSYSAIGQVATRTAAVAPALVQETTIPAVVVVPFKTKWGATGTAVMGTGPNCGNPFGLQQMLKDLGYQVDVDGIVGPMTMAAVGEYAIGKGLPYTVGAPPEGPVCAVMAAEWSLQQGKPVPPVEPPPGLPATICPPGTVFNISTLSCVPDGTQPPPVEPPPMAACPEGTWGIPPACIQVPGSQPPTTPPSVPVLPVTTTCPDGTYNNWPACLLPPGTPPPPVPPSVACPEGTEGTFPNCTAVAKPPPPGPKPGPNGTVQPAKPAEAGMSVGAKVAIGAAVVGGVGALALILTAKPKKATPNRRRRTSRRKR